MPVEKNIRVELPDALTVTTCSQLIAECIKYVLYLQEQIPYNYERLKFVVNSRRSQEKVGLYKDKEVYAGAPKTTNVYFKFIASILDSLEHLFECILKQLSDKSSGVVKEVALILGDSPYLPSQTYRFVVPEINPIHSDKNHENKDNILYLFRNVMFKSIAMNEMMNQKLPILDYYVLIKKDVTEAKMETDWFYHKPNVFEKPMKCLTAWVKFYDPPDSELKCSCLEKAEKPVPNLTVEELNISGIELLEPDEKTQPPCEETNTQRTYKWYAAPIQLRGFRDFKICGKSVTDEWLKPK